MLPQILALYNDKILAWFLERYDIDRETVRFLGDFDSFVYEFTREDKNYILKITHSIRRTSEYLLGEINWLNYLVDQDVSAARAVTSILKRMA
jgi:amicoumacin kinase